MTLDLDEVRELYQEVILDHGKHPRNYRRPEDASCQARGDNPLCGDRIQVFLKLGADGTIEDAAFHGRGCAISQASASLMTEMVKGKSVAEVERLFGSFHSMCTSDEFALADQDAADADDLERLQVLSGVRAFPTRVKCATLAWHTMKAALEGGGEVTTE